MTSPLLLETLRLTESAHSFLSSRPHTKDPFWTFRPYEAGDMASLIDWRQSGRADKLFLREREKEAPQTITLWCNLAPMSEEGKKIYPLLLALAYLVTEQGAEISWLAEPPLTLQTSKGFEAWAEKVISLSETEKNKKPARRLPAKSWFVLAGDFTATPQEWQKWLRAIQNESPMIFLELFSDEKPPKGSPTATLAKASQALLVQNQAEKPMEAILKLFSLLFSATPRLSQAQGLW